MKDYFKSSISLHPPDLFPPLLTPLPLRQVERDVMVWNNKMYRAKPMLMAEDSLIAQHRR